MSVIRYSEKCPWRACVCTHTDGCVKGWMDNADGTTRPCPICRTTRQQFPDEDREQWMDRLRAQDAAWARSS